MIQKKSRARRTLSLLCAAAVVLTAALAFLPSLEWYFLQDDFVVIGQFFAENDAFELPRNPDLNFPLGFLPFWTHLADSFFWGVNPFGHHLTNLLLHVLASAGVFVLVVRLAKGRLAVALFTALFFALCSLHVNAVGWISGRTVPLATVFCLAGILAALRRERSPIFTSVCYVAALVSHPAAFSLPLVVILLDTLGLGRSFWKRFVGVYLPLLVLMAAWYGMLRLSDQRLWRTEATLAALEPAALLETLKRLVLPLNEALTNPDKTPILKWAVFFVALPIQILLLIIRRAAPPRLFYVGLGWFVLMMVPIISRARLGPDLADSRLFYGVLAPLYLMAAALFFADTAAVRQPPGRSSGRGATIRAALTGLLFCSLLGFLLYKNHQAYAGADRLVHHVQKEALASVQGRSTKIVVAVMDPPARYGGAPVFSSGLREALRPPFFHDVNARQIIVVESRHTRPLVEHLSDSHSPLGVMWMNPRGRNPSGPLRPVSPVFLPAGDPPHPYTPPQYTGPDLDTWSLENGLAGSVDGTGFQGSARSEDPWFLSHPMVIPAHWVLAVEVHMSATGIGTAPVDLFWSLLENPGGFSRSRNCRRILPLDGRIHPLHFPLGADPSSPAPPERYLARIRLDPPISEEIRIESIRLLAGPACPGPDQERTWKGSDLQTWTAAPGTVSALEGKDLRITTRGEDPYVVSSDLRIPAGAVRTVEITMMVDAPSRDAALYWSTLNEPEFSETRSRHFNLRAGRNEYFKYTLTFTGPGRLDPKAVLKAIRIDPMSGPGMARIRSIRLVKAGR